jgi:hypothetical protein
MENKEAVLVQLSSGTLRCNPDSESNHFPRLVNTMGSTTIGTVHAASTSSLMNQLVSDSKSRGSRLKAYLETRASCQASSKLHHRTADFVTDASATSRDGGTSGVMTSMASVAVMCCCHWLMTLAATSGCCCGSCCCNLLTSSEALHKSWLAGRCVLSATSHYDDMIFLKRRFDN